MRFITTQNKTHSVSLEEAIIKGMPDQGGLYLPEEFPIIEDKALNTVGSYVETAYCVMAPFFKDSSLFRHLKECIQTAFNFPVPLKTLKAQKKYSLELFHGPTGAFKDFGARFLAQCLSYLIEDKQKTTILTATSGDTGGAVASAFDQSDKADVVILYPKGRISPFQEHQLTCWSDNIFAFSVNGNFDQCQAIVKQIFLDPQAAHAFRLSSANSINIARLFAQMSYYAHTALLIKQQTGKPASFIVPTGNMGNGLACYWTKKMGFPIDTLIFATNANKIIPDYFKTGLYQPQKTSLETLANAMDVANPSNFERFHQDVKQRKIVHPERLKDVLSVSVSDEEIKNIISTEYKTEGLIWCPHTATALKAYQTLKLDQKNQPWVSVATAHPYKFKDSIEGFIKQKIPPLNAFKEIEDRPTHSWSVNADKQAVLNLMKQLLK